MRLRSDKDFGNFLNDVTYQQLFIPISITRRVHIRAFLSSMAMSTN